MLVTLQPVGLILKKGSEGVTTTKKSTWQDFHWLTKPWLKKRLPNLCENNLKLGLCDSFTLIIREKSY